MRWAFRFSLGLVIVQFCTAAFAQDEKQTGNEAVLAELEGKIAVAQKQLELINGIKDLATKQLELAREELAAAEQQLETAKANAQKRKSLGRVNNLVAVASVATTTAEADPKSCVASDYVAFHCNGKEECNFHFSRKACVLPAADTTKMVLDVSYSCGDTEQDRQLVKAIEFENANSEETIAKYFLTCF